MRECLVEDAEPLDDAGDGLGVLVFLDHFLVEVHAAETGDCVVAEVEEEARVDRWLLVVVADEAEGLNRAVVTLRRRKRMVLRPALKFTGLDLVPSEYFFW